MMPGVRFQTYSYPPTPFRGEYRMGYIDDSSFCPYTPFSYSHLLISSYSPIPQVASFYISDHLYSGEGNMNQSPQEPKLSLIKLHATHMVATSNPYPYTLIPYTLYLIP